MYHSPVFPQTFKCVSTKALCTCTKTLVLSNVQPVCGESQLITCTRSFLQSCRVVVGLHSRGQIHHQPPPPPRPHVPTIPKGVSTPCHSHRTIAYVLVAPTTPVRTSHRPERVNGPTPSWPSPWKYLMRSGSESVSKPGGGAAVRNSRYIGGSRACRRK